MTHDSVASTNQMSVVSASRSVAACSSLYEVVSNVPPANGATVPERFLSTSAPIPGRSSVPREFRSTSAPTLVPPRRSQT